jgi:hypothetical protein
VLWLVARLWLGYEPQHAGDLGAVEPVSRPNIP